MSDLLFKTSWSCQESTFPNEGLQSHGIWQGRLPRVIPDRRSLIEQRHPAIQQEQYDIMINFLVFSTVGHANSLA
jgi:hypothetical protein